MPSAYGPITLGELIEQLEATYKNPLPEYFDNQKDKERQIYFDWCDLRPDYFHSYRGYYDHLAVAIRSHPTETVADFLKRCREQIGAEHSGWKGGDYTMDAKTPVWVVPESGMCPGFGITGVRDEGYKVVLTTQKFD